MTDGKTFTARVWSPDGRSLLGYTISTPAVDPEPVLFLFNVENKTYHQLQKLDKVHQPMWLPDSRRILLWRRGERELRLLDRETGAIVSAGSMPENVYDLTLSPDGRSLFGEMNVAEGDIWMLDYGESGGAK